MKNKIDKYVRYMSTLTMLHYLRKSQMLALIPFRLFHSMSQTALESFLCSKIEIQGLRFFH